MGGARLLQHVASVVCVFDTGGIAYKVAVLAEAKGACCTARKAVVLKAVTREAWDIAGAPSPFAPPPVPPRQIR